MVRRLPSRALALVIAMATAPVHGVASDLSYENYRDLPDQKFACLYAYAADKTGNHEFAIKILNDCVAAGNVWAMIWLAMLYENGHGVPKSLEKSAELMRRGAETDDEAGYSSLARYHWGMALITGTGVAKDEAEGLRWLHLARDEGVEEAAAFLREHEK